MTKEQAKELLPIIQAFVDGKTIQYRISPSFPRPNNCDISYLKEWFDLDEDKCDGFSCDGTIDYRIKTEPKYRPFKNANECFEEMKKHEPFGWIINTYGNYFSIIQNDKKVTITTKGFGHGVGMSQYGALGMAKEGYTYDKILKHYYLNTEIKKF